MSEPASASPTADTGRPAPPFYAEVDTPALVLDRAKLQRNIRRMADFAAGGPAKLRPHAKTHKCVEIAKLQLDAGAIGITCAKVGEAEALADGGIADILIANQIIGPLKIARLVELAGRCTVTVAVDDADNVRAALGGRRRGRRHAARVRRGERRHGPLRRRAGRARAGAGSPGRRRPGPRLRRPAGVRGPPPERHALRGARDARPRRHEQGADGQGAHRGRRAEGRGRQRLRHRHPHGHRPASLDDGVAGAARTPPWTRSTPPSAAPTTRTRSRCS